MSFVYKDENKKKVVNKFLRVIFQIFVEARDKKSSKSEALRGFVNAMGEVEMLVGKKWVIMAAENW